MDDGATTQPDPDQLRLYHPDGSGRIGPEDIETLAVDSPSAASTLGIVAEGTTQTGGREPDLGFALGPAYTGPPTLDASTAREGSPVILPIVPGYELLAILGRGGMGIVYLARQLRLNRPCALKMILAGEHAGPDAVARFLKEAETVARLRHPHIVQIHSMGDHDGRPYLELEYLEGGSLARKLQGRPLPAREAAGLVEALTHAVHEAHRQGIVHRDLKPGNVLLTADGVPKVGDFGLAKSLTVESGLTLSDSTLGTPGYMAPEQAAGHAKLVGPLADVYALGAILYDLATGRPPFRAATPLETLEQARSLEPVPPCRLQPSLPRDLETICLKCLRKEPDRRYASAEALGDDLRRFLAGEPILARAVPAWERAWKWTRRRPVPAALGAALLLAIVALLAQGVWSYRRIGLALDAARAHGEAAERARVDEEVQRRAAVAAQLDAERARAEAVREKNKAEAETYRAMFSEARALRVAHAPGWRREALASLARLASFDTPGRDPVALRGEAVACLGAPDLHEVARFEGLSGVRALDFDRGGKLLATAGSDGRLHVWDLSRMASLAEIIDPAADPARLYSKDSPWPAVRFRPDGAGLAYATWAQGVETIRPTDRSGSRLLAAPLGPPRALDFDRTGARVAVSWADGRAGVYATATGDPIRVEEVPADCHQVPVALAPAGDRFATAGPDHAVRLWGLDGSGPITLGRHAENVRALAFGPDGTVLASASSDNTVTLWFLDQERKPVTLRGHASSVNGVAFSPEGDLIATVGDDQSLRLWAVRGGEPRLVLRPGLGPLTAVAFGPDGTRLAVGADLAVVYELSGRRERRELAGHSYEIADLVAHPRRPLFLSASFDREVIAWDWETGRPGRRWIADETHPIRVLAVSPDGRRVAVGPGSYDTRRHRDFPIGIWDLDREAPLRLLPGHRKGLTALAFDPTGLRLASGDEDGEVILWDVAEGTLLHRESPESDAVRALAFLADGSTLVVGQGDRISLRDLERRDPPRAVAVAGGVRRFVVEPGEARLIVAGGDGAIRAFGLPGLGPLRSLEHAHEGGVVALAIRGRLLATAGADRRVVLRDARTLRPLVELPGREGPAAQLAFDRACDRLAIGGVEDDVTLWDLALVRRDLAALGLDWDAPAAGPPAPPPPPIPPAPVRPPHPEPSSVDRAWGHMSVGESRRAQDRPGEAMDAYLAALDCWYAIVRDEPAVPFYRSELAVTLAAIALLDAQSGRPDLARPRLQVARDLVEPLRDLDPRVAFNRARVRSLAGVIAGPDEAGRLRLAEGAIAALRDALAAGFNDARQLNENPDLNPLRDRADFREILGRRFVRGWPSLRRQGQADADRGRYPEAIAQLGAVRETLQALLDAEPGDAWTRAQLALTCSYQGMALIAAGQAAAARAAIDEARAHLESIPAPDPEAWYALARALAQLGRDHHEDAVSALSRAVDAGLAEPTRLDADVALDPLRARPDFRELAVRRIFADPFVR